MPDHWTELLLESPAYEEYRRTLAAERDDAIDRLRNAYLMTEAELRDRAATIYTLHRLYTRQPAREDPS